MGGMSSFEFVPSSYKIKYVDSLLPSNITGLDDADADTKGRKYKVIIPDSLVEHSGKVATNAQGTELVFE